MRYLGGTIRGQLPLEVPEESAEGVVLGDLVHLIQYQQADHAKISHALLQQLQVQTSREERHAPVVKV